MVGAVGHPVYFSPAIPNGASVSLLHLNSRFRVYGMGFSPRAYAYMNAPVSRSTTTGTIGASERRENADMLS